MINADEIKRVNRLEILMFTLGTKQRFGINVLKVKELMPCPELTQFPDPHPAVRGVVQLRGYTLSVIDLAKAVGLTVQDTAERKLIITEFNRVVHGFLVHEIDRITVLDWADIRPPSVGLGRNSYITGVTKVDNSLVQILDVERVLEDIGVYRVEGSETLLSDYSFDCKVPILVVDDSNIARKQTVRTLDQLGLSCITAKDGREAMEVLQSLSEGDTAVTEKVAMVISDIEMPELDGYTLTREIRHNAKLKDLYVLLHSSLNGVMNNDLAEKVGANASLTKFMPALLAKEIARGLGGEE
ncbi:MAG: chemotaxis protein [Gammaproteobacteria bacterium]|nr:chemotaxis protein [Gammaproteobacteria bacterium]